MEQQIGSLAAVAENIWQFQCHRYHHRDGSQCLTPLACNRHHDKTLMWEDGFLNDMTTVGLNKLLDATLKTGLTSPAWYVGLIDNSGFSAFSTGDTSASHAGWTESADYSEGTRQAFTPGSISAGSVSNTASKAVFTMNATKTIHGGFLIDNSTKSGSTGVLYGEGAFSSNRSVISGDVLSVTVTATIAAA